MKTKSLFALTSLALTSAVMASPPVNPAGLEVKPAAKPKDAIEVVPKIAICREAPVCDMPAPASRVMKLKEMEANEESIQSILNNAEAKTTVDKLNAPVVIKSMEEANKHLTRASMEKLAELVDFKKQQIAIFAWQGSGQDRLNGHLAAGDGAAVRFHYSPGWSADLRTHNAIYAMPKNTNLAVVKMEQRIIRCGVGQLDVQPLPEAVEGIELNVKPAPGVQKLEIQIEPVQKRGE